MMPEGGFTPGSTSGPISITPAIVVVIAVSPKSAKCLIHSPVVGRAACRTRKGFTISINGGTVSVTCDIRRRTNAQGQNKGSEETLRLDVTSKRWQVNSVTGIGRTRFCIAFGCSIVFMRLQFFAWFEADSFARRDRNFFAGPRIATHAAFSRLDDKPSEAAQLNPFASCQRLFH